MNECKPYCPSLSKAHWMSGAKREATERGGAGAAGGVLDVFAEHDDAEEQLLELLSLAGGVIAADVGYWTVVVVVAVALLGVLELTMNRRQRIHSACSSNNDFLFLCIFAVLQRDDFACFFV